MKIKIITLLIVIVVIAPCSFVYGQGFDFELVGNPVDTTGWNMSNDSHIEDSTIVLTNPQQSQAGFIYYREPQDLANCSQFTVSFDFRITNSSSPTADGLAFWYITNPPSNFVSGGGIGLPSNPNGLLLILDTYNNNGSPDDNPIISLRRMLGNADYVEGSSNGLLTPDLTYQSFITDGNWHHCVLEYYYGQVTVSFDGNPPIMTGNATLNITGYFGFSAGTGAKWAKHAIKDVHITGAPQPDAPVTDTVYYCQYDSAAPLTAQPDTGLLWYDSPQSTTPLSGPPTPATDIAGTFIWYVAQEVPNCNIESNRTPAVVIVRPLPIPPVISVPEFCSGLGNQALQVPPGDLIKWFPDRSGGTGMITPPSISTDSAATYRWYVTQTDSFGCESLRDSVDIVVNQSPELAFDYNIGNTCLGDTVFFDNHSQYADQYLWRYGDGQASDTTFNGRHYYPNAGNYFPVLIGRNHNCIDSLIKIVSLGHSISAGFSVSEDTICQGTKVNFINTSQVTSTTTVNAEYYWFFGDGTTSHQKNISHTYDTPGIYKVTLIVKSSIPCFDTAYHTIVVDPLPSLSVSVTDTPICKGDQIVFTGHYEQAGLQHIIWQFDESIAKVVDRNPVSHAYDESGRFPVTLVAHYRACPDTAVNFSVKVRDIPYLSIGKDTSLCLDGSPIVLTDEINENNPEASWLWNTGNTTSSLTIKQPGHYWVRVTVDNCSTRDDIIVNKDCYIDIPNSFTPNGDGVNDYFLPQQLLSRGVTGFSMQIFNRWGEEIFETHNLNGRGWDGRFNGKPQPMGVYVYFISVTLKNGRQVHYQGNITLLR